MALQLAPDEPEAGPWHAEPLAVAAATIMQPGQGPGAGHRLVVLAVDGRSSSGKTTLAGRLRDVVAGAAVVHTDDIAWCRLHNDHKISNHAALPRPTGPAGPTGQRASRAFCSAAWRCWGIGRELP